MDEGSFERRTLVYERVTLILEGDIETVVQTCISQDQQERLEELAASTTESV